MYYKIKVNQICIPGGETNSFYLMIEADSREEAQEIFFDNFPTNDSVDNDCHLVGIYKTDQTI